MSEYHSSVEVSEEHGNVKPTFHNSRQKGHRFIAAEIEIASSKESEAHLINTALYNWQALAVPDGSLPYSGYEINTTPAKGEKFENQIGEICEALNTAGAKVTRSCGLHIHVDCRDVRYLDLKRIIQTYWFCEDDLFSMLAPSRRRNHYCERLKQSSLSLSTILNTKTTYSKWRYELIKRMYNGDLKYYAKNKYNENRYYALNIHSWFYRKTLEFRHHQGTSNAFKIIAWGKICETIVNFGMAHSEDQIFKHFENNSEPLASILEPKLKSYFLERREYFKNNSK